MEKQLKFEYVVSVGEGTLLAYGIVDDDMPPPMDDDTCQLPGFMCCIALAADDCVTGQ